MHAYSAPAASRRYLFMRHCACVRYSDTQHPVMSGPCAWGPTALLTRLEASQSVLGRACLSGQAAVVSIIECLNCHCMQVGGGIFQCQQVQNVSQPRLAKIATGPSPQASPFLCQHLLQTALSLSHDQSLVGERFRARAIARVLSPCREEVQARFDTLFQLSWCQSGTWP